MHKLFGVIGCGFVLSILAGTAAVRALDLYADTLPQSQSNTCQSYAAVLALAIRKDPAFPIETFGELRAQETEFRSILEGAPGGPYSHTEWPKAMERMTGGKYTLSVTYVPDIVAWMAKVKGVTGSRDSISAAVETLSGNSVPTVMTSVEQVDGNRYSSGHIVSILGTIGSGLNSDTRVVAFNSAIKGRDQTIFQCHASDRPGDERYRAGIVETQNFKLKKFSAGYLLMTLKKK